VIVSYIFVASKLSWNINTTQDNSALHPSEVAKSSTSFGSSKSGKVTAAGWQVTLQNSKRTRQIKNAQNDCNHHTPTEDGKQLEPETFLSRYEAIPMATNYNNCAIDVQQVKSVHVAGDFRQRQRNTGAVGD